MQSLPDAGVRLPRFPQFPELQGVLTIQRAGNHRLAGAVFTPQGVLQYPPVIKDHIDVGLWHLMHHLQPSTILKSPLCGLEQVRGSIRFLTHRFRFSGVDYLLLRFILHGLFERLAS
jgi:hypothetical protein